MFKVGLIKARFVGRVKLGQTEALNALSLSGREDGAIAGLVKGGAEVKLIENDGETRLRYRGKNRN